MRAEVGEELTVKPGTLSSVPAQQGAHFICLSLVMAVASYQSHNGPIGAGRGGGHMAA